MVSAVEEEIVTLEEEAIGAPVSVKVWALGMVTEVEVLSV